MDFEKNVPEWTAEGTEPPASLKENGFEAGYKPPAAFFNWFWNSVSACLTEIRNKLKGHAEDKNNPHGVTKEQLGLGNVSNVSDTEKYVKYAQSAGSSDKVGNALTIRLNGGRTEGTDAFTFDGSTGRTVNITPEKIGAAEKDLSNVDVIKKYDRVVNLLDNSDFRSPVNQRGKTLYDTAGYTIDRWVLNNTSGSVTVNADSITVTNTSSDGQAWFGQRVPNAARYIGKTVTMVAVRTDGTVHVKSGIVSETSAIGYNNGTDLSMRIEAVTTDALRFNLVVITPGKSITFAYAALYEGNYTADTLPEYMPKGYAAELAECQRYYVRFQAASDAQIIQGASNGNNLYTSLHLPVAMRIANPTLAYDEVNIYPYITGAAYDVTSLTVVGTAKTGNFVALRAAHGNNSMEAGAPGCIRILAGGYIELSADL